MRQTFTGRDILKFDFGVLKPEFDLVLKLSIWANVPLHRLVVERHDEYLSFGLTMGQEPNTLAYWMKFNRTIDDVTAYPTGEFTCNQPDGSVLFAMDGFIDLPWEKQKRSLIPCELRRAVLDYEYENKNKKRLPCAQGSITDYSPST